MMRIRVHAVFCTAALGLTGACGTSGSGSGASTDASTGSSPDGTGTTVDGSVATGDGGGLSPDSGGAVVDGGVTVDGSGLGVDGGGAAGDGGGTPAEGGTTTPDASLTASYFIGADDTMISDGLNPIDTLHMHIFRSRYYAPLVTGTTPAQWTADLLAGKMEDIGP